MERCLLPTSERLSSRKYLHLASISQPSLLLAISLQGSSKGWSSRLGKTSPNQAGKGIEGNGEFTGKESLSLKAGLRRPFSISNQSSPTGSLDSQGSGITNRSHDSLHRPTPIPSDASHSLSMYAPYSHLEPCTQLTHLIHSYVHTQDL